MNICRVDFFNGQRFLIYVFLKFRPMANISYLLHLAKIYSLFDIDKFLRKHLQNRKHKL